MSSSEIPNTGDGRAWERSGRKQLIDLGSVIKREEESPAFYFFNRLPRELRELILELVILHELKDKDISPQGFSWGLEFRFASRAIADESRPAFCEHPVFHIRPCEYDESQNTRSISDVLIPRIQNLQISLTREHNHKFDGQNSIFTSFTTYDLLEDRADNISKFRSQGIRRNVCRLFAETNDNEFQAPRYLIRRLQRLGDFKSVIFEGHWVPSSWKWMVPEGPFESLRIILEWRLGPATIIDDHPYHTQFEFHPRRYQDMGYESSDGESDMDNDDDGYEDDRSGGLTIKTHTKWMHKKRKQKDQ